MSYFQLPVTQEVSRKCTAEFQLQARVEQLKQGQSLMLSTQGQCPLSSSINPPEIYKSLFIYDPYLQ